MINEFKFYPWLVNRDPRPVAPLVSFSPIIDASVVGALVSHSPAVASNSKHVQGNGTVEINFSLDVSYSVSNRGNGSNVNQHRSAGYLNKITCSGQTFPNATIFRDALYPFSIGWRFRYRFKRNTVKHMCIVCMASECPWEIACRAIGALSVAQVHTFINEHNHSVDDLIECQPIIRSNRAAVVIDEII